MLSACKTASRCGWDGPGKTIFRDIASFRTALWIFQHDGCYLFDAILDLTTVRATWRPVGVVDVVISLLGLPIMPSRCHKEASGTSKKGWEHARFVTEAGRKDFDRRERHDYDRTHRTEHRPPGH